MGIFDKFKKKVNKDIETTATIINEEELSPDKDGFYYTTEFSGSDRCGVEFLNHKYNLDEIESIPCAGPCSISRYKKENKEEPAYLFYSHGDEELYFLYILK